MNGDVSIDLGSAIQYTVDQILEMLGKGYSAEEFGRKLQKQMSIAVAEASHVQCIGMYRPIPIGHIYQPLQVLDQKGRSVSPLELVTRREDFIVHAGPGDGKTTLLHWLFLTLLQKRDTVALLYTLRGLSAVEDLEELVRLIVAGGAPRRFRKHHFILFLDGYDEIDLQRRRMVSKILLEFTGSRKGTFCLTCRDHYDVLEVSATRYKVAPFGEEEAVRYIAAFATEYEATIDGPCFYVS